MPNGFFKNGDKAYSENLNDSILVGNAFDWTVDISLPTDTGSVFPNSSTVVKAKVADVYISPNSNLSIGSTISNSSGSSQVYRLTVYPDFNRFGGFKSITLTADSGVTFYIANKGGTSPIANNLDYTNLGNVPELKVLKEYDIVVTIPTGKSVTGLGFVLQSTTADVNGEISQSNVTGLTTSLNALADGKVDKVTNKGLSTNDFTDTYKGKLDDVVTWKTYANESNYTIRYNEVTRIVLIGISQNSYNTAGHVYDIVTIPSNLRPLSSFAQTTYSITDNGTPVGHIRVNNNDGKLQLILQTNTNDITVYGSLLYPY